MFGFGKHKREEEQKRQYEEAQRRLQEQRRQQEMKQQQAQVQARPAGSAQPAGPLQAGPAASPGQLQPQRPQGQVVGASNGSSTVQRPAGGTTVPVSAQQSNGTTYTVQRGDTLSGIAKRMLGDAGQWRTIFEANRGLIKDPDRIYPGQVLSIPRSGSGNKPLA